MKSERHETAPWKKPNLTTTIMKWSNTKSVTGPRKKTGGLANNDVLDNDNENNVEVFADKRVGAPGTKCPSKSATRTTNTARTDCTEMSKSRGRAEVGEEEGHDDEEENREEEEDQEGEKVGGTPSRRLTGACSMASPPFWLRLWPSWTTCPHWRALPRPR